MCVNFGDENSVKGGRMQNLGKNLFFLKNGKNNKMVEPTVCLVLEPGFNPGTCGYGSTGLRIEIWI